MIVIGLKKYKQDKAFFLPYFRTIMGLATLSPAPALYKKKSAEIGLAMRDYFPNYGMSTEEVFQLLRCSVNLDSCTCNSPYLANSITWLCIMVGLPYVMGLFNFCGTVVW